jgi:tRNA1(Val) A37 N6-methylase TrmN6
VFIYQPTSGYCYNSDSIFLYQFISGFKPKGNLLDVGCGVGIISLLLSRDFPIKTSIVDKQQKMLNYAIYNYEKNRQDVQGYLGDFVTEFTTDERYDFIVSNPPFYDSASTQSEDIQLNIARYAHHLPIESFIKRVKTFLKPKGWFIFCYDTKHIDALLHHLKLNGMNPEKIQFVHAKSDKKSKLVMIAARNNSKAMTQILAPYIVMDKDSSYMSKAQEAFDNANTTSIKEEL